MRPFFFSFFLPVILVCLFVCCLSSAFALQITLALYLPACILRPFCLLACLLVWRFGGSPGMEIFVYRFCVFGRTIDGWDEGGLGK
jgi:hypothetical protein